MPTFRLCISHTVTYLQHATVEIEADSLEAAHDKALEQAHTGAYGHLWKEDFVDCTQYDVEYAD